MAGPNQNPGYHFFPWVVPSLKAESSVVDQWSVAVSPKMILLVFGELLVVCPKQTVWVARLSPTGAPAGLGFPSLMFQPGWC